MTKKTKKTTMPKRPKSLDAPVVMQLHRLEAWAYLRCDQWKKKYRYTLVNDFRQHLTNAKNNAIRAFELSNRYKNEKAYLYNQSLADLTLAESCTDVMITVGIDIMSEKEWSNATEQIETIRVGLSRLVSSLIKGVSGSDSPDYGKGRATANHKEA